MNHELYSDLQAKLSGHLSTLENTADSFNLLSSNYEDLIRSSKYYIKSHNYQQIRERADRIDQLKRYLQDKFETLHFQINCLQTRIEALEQLSEDPSLYQINLLRRMLKAAGFDVVDYPNADDQILVFFPNGYGASVIVQGPLFARTRKVGLLELAVIKETGNKISEDIPWPWDWDIVYDTPITGNVIGDLTAEEAFEIIQDIKTLENDNEE